MTSAPTPSSRGCDRLRAARRAQRGISLVEIMVALAIGLVVVLIATTIYIQGISSVGFRLGQSENLGNSRQVLGTLDLALSRAGYRRDPTQPMTDAFPADAAALANGCRFDAGEAIKALDKQTLCIRFQARDDDETDCEGQPATTTGLAAYERPSPSQNVTLVEKYQFNSATGKLVCQTGTQANTTQDVADGVRDVLFEFGIGAKTDGFAERSVESFSKELPDTDQEALRSLRYAVLLTSTAGGLTGGMTSSVCTRWIALGGAAASCDTSRGQLHQLATGSLTLRNLMP